MSLSPVSDIWPESEISESQSPQDHLLLPYPHSFDYDDGLSSFSNCVINSTDPDAYPGLPSSNEPSCSGGRRTRLHEPQNSYLGAAAVPLRAMCPKSVGNVMESSNIQDHENVDFSPSPSTLLPRFFSELHIADVNQGQSLLDNIQQNHEPQSPYFTPNQDSTLVGPDPMGPDTVNVASNKCNGDCEGVFLFVSPIIISLSELMVFHSGPHQCFFGGISFCILCTPNDSLCIYTFDNRVAYNRHYWYDHCSEKAKANPLFDCPLRECERFGPNGITRKDNLTQHRRLCHGEKIEKRMSYSRTRQRAGNGARARSNTRAQPGIGKRVRRRKSSM